MPEKTLHWLLIIFPLASILFSFPAGAVDLNRETIYVRRDFNPAWINSIPAPEDREWFSVPGVESGSRSVVLMDLPLEGMPRRTMFSLKKHAPMEFTFLTSFSMKKEEVNTEKLRGLYFHNIGENWSIYFNGHLLRSEVHLDDRGEIQKYRHHRDVVIPVNPRFFREGKNIITARIIGDPTNIDSGFHRSVPFILDDLTTLEHRRSERASLVLIFLYLFFGVYHLFIFIKKTSEKHTFYYGAFSILLFVYLFSRTHAVYAFIPDSTLLHRIEYCSLYALLPLFGAFIDRILTGRYGGVTKFFGLFYSLLILITALPVSNPFAIDILRVWQVSAIIPLFYYTFVRIGYPVASHFNTLYSIGKGVFFPYRFVKAAGRALTTTTAGNIMLGALVMVGCAVFDILDSMFWSYNLVLSTYGFFVFTAGISLILADRFIATHNRLERTGNLINREMELAAHIQQSMLPSIPGKLDDWDIALYFKPLYGPSGDMYDVYTDGRTLRGISLFDVSGHGISSALLTMIIKPIAFRAFNDLKKGQLDGVFETVERRLAREIPESETMISWALLRTSGNMVEYINAGHPNLLHRNRKTGQTGIVDLGGKYYKSRPLGTGLFGPPPLVIKFRTAPGDFLVLYTDCLLESRNAGDEIFGIDRIIDSLNRTPGETAGDVLDHLIAEFDSFIDRKRVRDDLTVIVARKK